MTARTLKHVTPSVFDVFIDSTVTFVNIVQVFDATASKQREQGIAGNFFDTVAIRMVILIR